VGIEYLDYAVKNVSIPFVAIGGIKTHNVGEVRRHGARCISIVTEIVGARTSERRSWRSGLFLNSSRTASK